MMSLAVVLQAVVYLMHANLLAGGPPILKQEHILTLGL